MKHCVVYCSSCEPLRTPHESGSHVRGAAFCRRSSAAFCHASRPSARRRFARRAPDRALNRTLRGARIRGLYGGRNEYRLLQETNFVSSFNGTSATQRRGGVAVGQAV